MACTDDRLMFGIFFPVGFWPTHLIVHGAADNVKEQVHVASVHTRQPFQHNDLGWKKQERSFKKRLAERKKKLSALIDI